MREQRDASLSELTTLGLGGTAARVIDVESERELAETICAADDAREPLFVLGGGSNVVASDTGWPGIVLRPALLGFEQDVEDGTVHLRVGAGVIWDELVATCVAQGWVGLSCLSGIPGWVGAAPLQNIGAYGHEVGDVLTAVRAFDRTSKTFTTFTREACGFGYRSSMFRNEHRYVVSRVDLVLQRSGGEVVRYPELARALGIQSGGGAPPDQVRDTVLTLRRSKGMVVDAEDPESRSAGSFFVNPMLDDAMMADVEARAVGKSIVGEGSEVPRYEASPGCWKVPAAWLIERAGFTKGTTISGVGISRKHALALVNRGGTAADLLLLEQTIRKGVMETFGVELSREPILIEPPAIDGFNR